MIRRVTTAMVSVLMALCLFAGPIQETHADEPYSVMMLSSKGLSTAIEPRVVNVGPPSIELRFSYQLRSLPWIELDAGLALIVYPEHVPELRVGARIFPIRAFSRLPVLRDLFVRVGIQNLLTLSGFDYAPNGEVGVAFSGKRLIGYLALSESYYMLHPRLTTDVRIGAGFRF
jgi:hypothetical protein